MLDAPLTRAERQFASENHRLIYGFLRAKKLQEDDYYSVAALGYLNAVRRYLSETKLKRFSFSTVAYRAMQRSVFQYRRSLGSQKRRVEAVSLETGGVNGGPLSRYAPSAETVLLAELEEQLLLHALAEKLPSGQFELVRLRLWGYGIHEIAVREGVSDKKIRKLLRQIREVFWEACCL